MRAKTALAVEIAQVDRDRFNEAVAAGHYPCAPHTLRGTTRLFEVDDVVALWVYGRMIDDDVPPRRAGRIVCELLISTLKNSVFKEPIEEVVEIRTTRSRFFLPSDRVNAADTHYGGFPLVYRRSWPVGRIRSEVVARLEWERDNLGSDD